MLSNFGILFPKIYSVQFQHSADDAGAQGFHFGTKMKWQHIDISKISVCTLLGLNNGVMKGGVETNSSTL